MIFFPPSLPAISKAPINVVQKYHLDTWLVTSRLWYVRVLHRDKRLERVDKQHVFMEAEKGINEEKSKERQKCTFSSIFHNERSRVC